MARRCAALAALFLLSACSSFFGGAPANLYRVTPVRSFPPNLPHRDARLVVDVPRAAPGLDTVRVALARPPVSIDYFADSAWVERAPLLVSAALFESFENSGALVAFDHASFDTSADFILKSEIRDFEAEYRSSVGPPEARVAIRVRLVRVPDRRIVGEAAFAANAQASANDVPHIVLALDRALDEVIGKIVVWTVTNPALSAGRR